MKSILTVLTAVILILLLLVSCAAESADTAASAASKSIEADTDTATVADAGTSQNATSAQEFSAEDSDSMIDIFMVLTLMEQADMVYDCSDPISFWTAVCYLAGSEGSKIEDSGEDSDGNITLSASRVREMASALFADFDGNKAELPKIPSEVTLVFHNADSDMYTFTPINFGLVGCTITECIPGTSFYFTVELKTLEDNAVIGTYKFTVIPTTYSGTAVSVYNYSVSSIQLITDSGSASPDFTLPDTNTEDSFDISESEALELIKAKYGTEDEATGSPFYWILAEITTIDGEAYYNFRMTCEITNNDGSTYSTYVTNIIVATDGSTVKTASYDSELSEWFILGDSLPA